MYLSMVTDILKRNAEDTLIGTFNKMIRTFMFIVKRNNVRYIASTDLTGHLDLIYLIVCSCLCFDLFALSL